MAIWGINIVQYILVWGWIEPPVPFNLHYLISFGLTLAGLLMTWVIAGKDGLGEQWGRICQWRIGVKGIPGER